MGHLAVRRGGPDPAEPIGSELLRALRRERSQRGQDPALWRFRLALGQLGGAGVHGVGQLHSERAGLRRDDLGHTLCPGDPLACLAPGLLALAQLGRVYPPVHDGGDRAGAREVAAGGHVQDLGQGSARHGGREDLALEYGPLLLAQVPRVSAGRQAGLQLRVYDRVRLTAGSGGVHGQEVARVRGKRLGLPHHLGCGPGGLCPVHHLGHDRQRIRLSHRLLATGRARPGHHVRRGGLPAPRHGHIQRLAGQRGVHEHVRGVHRAALGHVDVARICQLGRGLEVVQRDGEVTGPGPVRELAPCDRNGPACRLDHALQAERIPVGQPASGRVHRAGVLPGPQEVTTRGPVAVRQCDLRALGHAAKARQLGPHHAGQLGRLLIRARQEERVPAHQVVRQIQGHRVPLGLGLVGAADPASRVIGPQRRPRALP